MLFCLIVLMGCSHTPVSDQIETDRRVTFDAPCDDLYAYAVDEHGDVVRCVHNQEDAI